MNFIPVKALSKCLKLQEEIFMNHAFTLILWGYHQSTGHSWDSNCRTWKN